MPVRVLHWFSLLWLLNVPAPLPQPPLGFDQSLEDLERQRVITPQERLGLRLVGAPAQGHHCGRGDRAPTPTCCASRSGALAACAPPPRCRERPKARALHPMKRPYSWQLHTPGCVLGHTLVGLITDRAALSLSLLAAPHPRRSPPSLSALCVCAVLRVGVNGA